MEIKFNIKTLKEAISKMATVIDPKHSIPVITNILFQSYPKKGVCVLTGTNLEMTLRVKVPILEGDDTSFLMPLDVVRSTINKLKKEEVTFVLNENVVNIISDNFEFEVTQEGSVEDFPLVANNPDTSISIPSTYISDSINVLRGFIADDDLRPVMNTLCCDIDNGSFIVCATDARKLCRRTYDLDYHGDKLRFLIPKNTLKSLNSICNEAETLEFYYNDKNLFFKNDNSLLILKSVEGYFPNYNAVIPTGYIKYVKVNKVDVEACLSPLEAYMNKTSKAVRIIVIGGEISFTCANLDFGRKGLSKASCESNDDFVVGVHFDNFLHFIKNSPTEDVEILFESDSKALIIDNDDYGFLSLVMPLILN